MITTAGFAQDCLEEIEIRLSRQTNTLYHIFNQVSRQTGFFFIYDSEIINSDEEVRIGNTHKNLKEFLRDIIQDQELEFKLLEKHILIYRAPQETVEEETIAEEESRPEFMVIQGRVLDRETGNPLPWSSVSISGKATGVVANANGIFKLRLPAEHIIDTIRVSHMGFKTREIPITILEQGFTEVSLQMDYISLQEIIISYFNPREILTKALSARTDNYPTRPTSHISFYREGIQKEEKIIFYTEAVLREYKSSYHTTQQDQVVMLQSRNISNIDRSDTLVFKLRAGVRSSGEMDIIKHIPDFLNPEFMDDYNFEAAGIIPVDQGLAYVIDFEQKPHIREPLHKGSLYIDKETMAIINIDFEINPRLIRRIQRQFIPRPNPNFITSIQSAKYSVSYRQHEGEFHLSHVRGELNLRARQRNRLFGRNYKVFFEKAIIQVETDNVQRPSRRESMRTNVVLSDQQFSYDYDFWGNYNIIPPEKEIHEALSGISSKIESLVRENDE